MNNTGRYELKFVLDELKFNEVRSWLYLNLKLREEYSTRIVNSLYFDDIKFQSVRDNLSGAPDRKKRRLRWYNDLQSRNEISPVLEAKWRSGRLIYKETCALPELKGKLLSIESRNIVSNINEILYAKESPVGVFDDHVEPTLCVNYNRQYYRDFEGLRVTIDRNITFNYIVPHSGVSEGPIYLYPNYVIEFKFPIELKNYVALQIKNSNLQPKRHSKYLAGLAAYGLVQYV